MDKLLEELIKTTKRPYIDIMYTTFGILFLFIINLIYSFDINKIDNLKNINSIILLIIFITISYYIGRFLKIISEIWLMIFWSIFAKNKKEKFIKFFQEIQNHINPTLLNINNSNNTITEAEIQETINNNDIIKITIDREILANIFYNLNIGLSIVLSFLQSYWFIISVLLFTILEMRNHIEIHNIKIDTMRWKIEKK